MIDLSAAGPDAGPKAATLGRLLRAGFPVPPGFVLPPGAELPQVEDRLYAVRSSASTEDTATESAAGVYDSFLGVRRAELPDRVAATRASLWSARAAAYRHTGAEMAVIVQQHIDADVSGVLFTGSPTVVEASWGLGESVVGGRVTPDSFTIVDGRITKRLGDKTTRVDRTATTAVSPTDQARYCLTDSQLRRLWQLGQAVEQHLGAPQDIEFAFEGDHLWLLQARPITIPLQGIAGSPGTATGPARPVHSPADFPRVRPGDILICRYTDPAWTPLFRVIAGIVTETGGRLSHAAIVAREHRIPAILGVPNALNIPENTPLTLNTTTATITRHPPP
ncbi:PEP/pyruvate-binding domain-containing protein [Kribbella sp. NPDC005582]|uniref:PEP/pyruvate-binding domain-containing protein n=1 Tax=Kribbella sp. NPDC005582 TaxID=3156893 RepID=UPI0033AAA904